MASTCCEGIIDASGRVIQMCPFCIREVSPGEIISCHAQIYPAYPLEIASRCLKRCEMQQRGTWIEWCLTGALSQLADFLVTFFKTPMRVSRRRCAHLPMTRVLRCLISDSSRPRDSRSRAARLLHAKSLIGSLLHTESSEIALRSHSFCAKGSTTTCLWGVQQVIPR